MTDQPTKQTVASSAGRDNPQLGVVRELFAGTMGGTAQILVGHPFDTVKVKLQSMRLPPPGQPPQYTGAIDVVRKVVSREGLAGLYAGIQAPLPFVAVFNATLFAANSTMRKVVGKGRPDDEMSIAQIGMAGMGAGAAVSFVACPTELVKCRLQAQPGAFAGAIDCTRQVVANRGMGGLFTGMGATITREMPGNALMFMMYNATMRAMCQPGQATKDLSAPQLMFAGGMAGFGKCLVAIVARSCCLTQYEYIFHLSNFMFFLLLCCIASPLSFLVTMLSDRFCKNTYPDGQRDQPALSRPFGLHAEDRQG